MAVDYDDFHQALLPTNSMGDPPALPVRQQMFDNYGSMPSPPVREYRMSNIEPQKYFEIRYSLFDILRFIEQPGYFFT
jgi:hypothetical protein